MLKQTIARGRLVADPEFNDNGLACFVLRDGERRDKFLLIKARGALVERAKDLRGGSFVVVEGQLDLGPDGLPTGHVNATNIIKT